MYQNSDEMLLKTNTSETGYLLDNIASITFLDEVGIKEIFETIDVNIFINSSSKIVVESPHQNNRLTVFDITGKQVALSSQSKMNVNFLNTGIYILQVATDKGSAKKIFFCFKSCLY